MTSGSGIDLASRSCILFDFDGTLADTKASIVATAHAVLHEWGMTDDQIGDAGRLVGPPFPYAFSLVYGLSEADAAEVCRRYRLVYDALGPESHPLFPGIAGMLSALRQDGRRLAVTSSKRDPLVHRMLEDDQVLDLFDVVVGQTDPAHADKASLVGVTLDRLGTLPDDAVMVGDRRFDAEGAHANGLPCVGALFGTAPRSELEDAGMCAIAVDAAELLSVLRGA